MNYGGLRCFLGVEYNRDSYDGNLQESGSDVEEEIDEEDEEEI